jgi:hypothetical protein
MVVESSGEKQHKYSFTFLYLWVADCLQYVTVFTGKVEHNKKIREELVHVPYLLKHRQKRWRVFVLFLPNSRLPHKYHDVMAPQDGRILRRYKEVYTTHLSLFSCKRAKIISNRLRKPFYVLQRELYGKPDEVTPRDSNSGKSKHSYDCWYTNI